MKKLIRYLKPQILADIQKKMVFVGGPRQVGKTTLAQSILDNENGYLNWDIAEHREQILHHEIPNSPILVFDEIHKYRSWRNYLKGIYDATHTGKKILVTGSARLDFYRYRGDSLQGRYHYLRLFPLSCSELKLSSKKEFFELMTLGGFPEPFFLSSDIEAKRWSREYRTRIIHDDIRSLENLQDLGNMELLMLRLPDLVGSPLSINTLREELQVSHKTIANWLQILERLYYIFRLSPFGSPKIRAVKKEQKHYHFDWTLVKDPALRFENMVALHLLKWVAFLEDTLGAELELRYFRDTDSREVDFVITDNKKPKFFIECKYNDTNVSKHLRYMKERFPQTEAWQLTALSEKNFSDPDNIHVCPAVIFLKNLI